MNRLTFFLTVILTMGFAPTTQAGLVAFYSGDGNANDSVSGQNGTLVNGAGFGSGLFGQSFLLNGTNQYISVPNSGTWTLDSNPFSINLWVNFNSVSSPQIFVGHDEGPFNVNKWFFFYDGLGHLEFHVNSPSQGPVFIAAPTTFTPTTNAWYDFAITRSGSAYTFYANAVSLGTATSTYTIQAANAPLTIGEAEGIDYLNGRIENVGFYDQALSASQIAQLSSVPEPSSLALVGLAGAIATAGATWRRRKSAVDRCPSST